MKFPNKLILPAALIVLISLCGAAILLMDSNGIASIQPINDRDYYPAVKEAFENADDYIHIVLYGSKYYVSDDRGDNKQVNSLLAELGDAVKRGVKVKVVFDESWDGIVDTAIYLKSLGVDVVFDDKKKTTHSKFIVIDDEIVIVGSTNWSYSALQKNHEANVLIRNEEIASEYEDYFDEIWDES